MFYHYIFSGTILYEMSGKIVATGTRCIGGKRSPKRKSRLSRSPRTRHSRYNHRKRRHWTPWTISVIILTSKILHGYELTLTENTFRCFEVIIRLSCRSSGHCQAGDVIIPFCAIGTVSVCFSLDVVPIPTNREHHTRNTVPRISSCIYE